MFDPGEDTAELPVVAGAADGEMVDPNAETDWSIYTKEGDDA